MAPALAHERARRLRMAALLLASDPAGRPAPADLDAVVTHLGAMQAQDAESGLWSLGIRLPGATRASVLAALEERTVLRTWPMRGTVHLVAARDAHWMLATTGMRPLAAAAGRRAALGLTDGDAERAADVIGSTLAGGRRLSRSALLTAVQENGIDTSGQRGYHLLMYASLRGVSAMAPDVDGETTFVLLDDWVPDPVRLDRDEALSTLARRFFRSHGPATLADFAGWTGLTMADARRALHLAAADLAEAELDGTAVWLDPALLDAPDEASPELGMIAPPGFDELILGAKDRRLHLAEGDLDRVVPGGNGVFRSTLVADGRVVATWTRATRGRRGAVTVHEFERLGRRERAAGETALERWAAYAGLDLQVAWQPA